MDMLTHHISVLSPPLLSPYYLHSNYPPAALEQDSFWLSIINHLTHKPALKCSQCLWTTDLVNGCFSTFLGSRHSLEKKLQWWHPCLSKNDILRHSEQENITKKTVNSIFVYQYTIHCTLVGITLVENKALTCTLSSAMKQIKEIQCLPLNRITLGQHKSAWFK